MLTLGNLQPRRNRGGKYLPRSTSYSSKIGKTLKKNYQMKIELIKKLEM